MAVAAALSVGIALFAPVRAAARDAPHRACALRTIPPADRVVHVPFETVDGRIYVQARVNGQGPFRFAVDTGASGIGRADASLLRALGLASQGQASTSDGVRTAAVETARLHSLELGALAHREIDVITRDYNRRNAPEAAFAGILAREFFADGLLVIDYPARTLSFTRAHALPTTGPDVLAYERAFRVPVSIGDRRLTGHLDTGANVAFVVPRALYTTLPGGVLGALGRGQLTNGEVDVQHATVPGPVRIGALTLSNVDVRVSERYPELLVGAQALQQAAVLIDQRSQRVAVCR